MQEASRNLAHIEIRHSHAYVQGRGLLVAEVSLPEDGVFFSLTVADRDWRFGERFSVVFISAGPTLCDLAESQITNTQL